MVDLHVRARRDVPRERRRFVVALDEGERELLDLSLRPLLAVALQFRRRRSGLLLLLGRTLPLVARRSPEPRARRRFRLFLLLGVVARRRRSRLLLLTSPLRLAVLRTRNSVLQRPRLLLLVGVVA
ncbi:MAG: hypothetical protein AAF633_09955, partial [Chloroflexota bacterium]